MPITQYARITIINPNNPVLVPNKVQRYAPASTISINDQILISVLLFLLRLGSTINISSNIIVPILFPDSNHPLYPICTSLYVYEDVPVINEIYISAI